jgi:mRNA interferase RelE/StbE
MAYKVSTSARFNKHLAKMDRSVAKRITKWIDKNLEDSANPRQHGKPLTGDLSKYWRYRVGDYRLIAEIHDEDIVIIMIDFAHRRKVYR